MNSLHQVYARLFDKESKVLYTARVAATIPSEKMDMCLSFLPIILESSLYRMFVEKHSKEIAALKKLYDDGTKICLFPATPNFGAIAVELLRSYGIEPYLFCDNNHEIYDKDIDGVPIKSCDDILALDNKIIMLCSGKNSVFNYYMAQVPNPKERSDLFFKFQKAYSDISPYYFREEFLTPQEDEVYIDCGVFDALDIKGFSDFCHSGYKKIIGFEAHAEYYKLASENIKSWNLRNVKLIPKAVYSKDAILKFDDSLHDGSLLTDNGNTEVLATSIDAVAKDLKVTFIKMDIEGSELDALKGAEQTIKRDKPRLAVCVYHKDEDIFDIPDYLLSIAPEYKFYLRSYSIGLGELVLYACI